MPPATDLVVYPCQLYIFLFHNVSSLFTDITGVALTSVPIPLEWSFLKISHKHFLKTYKLCSYILKMFISSDNFSWHVCLWSPAKFKYILCGVYSWPFALRASETNLQCQPQRISLLSAIRMFSGQDPQKLAISFHPPSFKSFECPHIIL